MHETTFIVIAVVLFFTMLGIPRTYAPFIGGLAGVVVTMLLNWGDLTSVEVSTDYALRGFGWGMAAVGTHKTISTVGELIEHRLESREQKKVVPDLR